MELIYKIFNSWVFIIFVIVAHIIIIGYHLHQKTPFNLTILFFTTMLVTYTDDLIRKIRKHANQNG